MAPFKIASGPLGPVPAAALAIARGALTRFIEAIDRKLIIEAKPRQPQRLTSTQCFRGCRFGSFGFSLLERCFGPLLAAAPMAHLKRSHPSGRSSITVFAFDLPIMAFALESSGSYVPRDR
jgi:hypothetical protein